MKTYLNITYRIGQEERTISFIRPRHLSTPTDNGAARMIAANLNKQKNDMYIRPSRISIIRIVERVYC